MHPVNEVRNFLAWVAVAWHHHVNGTLAEAPSVGNVAMAPINPDKPTPPVPQPLPVVPPVVAPIVPAIIATATAAPSAPSMVAGMDTPTHDGDVKLDGIQDAHAASFRYLTFAALPMLTTGTLAYAQTEYNCAMAKSEETFGWLYGMGKRLIAGTDSLTGLPNYHPDTTEGQNIPGVLVVPAEYDTVEKAVAHINANAHAVPGS